MRTHSGLSTTPGRSSVPEILVLDASAVVEVLAGTELSSAVSHRIAGAVWYGPAHLDAEVLSALGRLARAGQLSDEAVAAGLAALARMPLTRAPLAPLLRGAWERREELRLVEAIYVELATTMSVALVTTDLRLARAAPVAEAITP